MTSRLLPTQGEARGVAIGSVVMTVFALLWAGGGIFALGLSNQMLVAAGVVIFVTVVLMVASVRLLRAARGLAPGEPIDASKRRALRLAFIFEAIAIPACAAFLGRTNRAEYIMPSMAVIVGLHFALMSRAFASARFLLTGAAMCALALATVLLLPPEIRTGAVERARVLDLWAVVIGFGCAAILWLSVASGMLRVFGQLRAGAKA